ncbi:MAG: phosphoribosyltransferase [Chromatiaceae bacterium]|nr:phosphoribosyltransferase [Chromatiaceae bacterium]MCF8005102.1 phosphoribosyltransferase [Chromatiaceae bacterium]
MALKPTRTPWRDFPLVVIHSPEIAVKRHPDYRAAKSGDVQAAFSLVKATIAELAVLKIRERVSGRQVILASAHAVERDGVNAIPEALADELSARLSLPVDEGLVQINIVGHTGANGFARLARPAAFDGEVISGATYLVVDDFVGQGGTLANLKGHIESNGGVVIGATVLTGKPFSAVLSPTQEQLTALRAKHGQTLEIWWHERFGYGFDSLTQSEARYLERSPDADIIRSRLIEEE